MKKYFIIFLLLSAFGFFYFYNPFQQSETTELTTDKSKYVSLSGKTFMKDGKPFYPVCLNYIVGMQTDRKNLWPCPSKAYNSGSNQFTALTKDACYKQLVADMELIKEMGFNSLRVIGIGDVGIADKYTQELYFRPSIGNEKDTTIMLSDKKNYDQYYEALGTFLHILDSMDLKAVLLLRMDADVFSTEKHLKKTVEKFKNSTAIMAYDFFNEPLYFDTIERQKPEVFKIVNKWEAIVKKHSPYHLTTVGLVGIREIFEWDPNILPVDFVSFHPYDAEPDQVMNEMYWYSKFVHKPWMLGETGLPADGDSVTHEEQKLFAERTLAQTYNCGAIGYSWWQYKEVEWFAFHPNYLGIVSMKGETKTKSGFTVSGTPKITVKPFKEFNPLAPKGKCICLDNYYNHSLGKAYIVKGKLVDEKGNGLEGGVIMAWSWDWANSRHTITKKDGSFELTADFKLQHWIASAPYYSTARNDFDLKKIKSENNSSILYMKNVVLKKLF